MWDSGKRIVVGDNSLTKLIPANPYHALMTTVAVHGFAGMAIIPRFSTEIYYHCPNPAEEVAFFNAQTWNPVDMTYEQVLQMEAYRTARGVLGLRRDAYMFHQGNVIKYNTTSSLLGDWLTTTTNLINSLIDLPVTSMPLSIAGKLAKMKMEVRTDGW